MLTNDLRPKKFSDMVGNDCAMNNKLLLALAKKPNYGPHTIMLTGDYGSGKAQPNDTMIPTPNGYKRLGDIVAGDYVFDRLGNPTKVLQVFPQGIKDCYEAHFTDGRIVKCCGEHLWSYRTSNGTLMTKSVLELIWNSMVPLVDEIPRSGTKTCVMVPLCEPVNYEEKELPMSPEALAYILSAGKLGKKHLTLKVCNAYCLSRYKEIFGDPIDSYVVHSSGKSYVPHRELQYCVFKPKTTDILKKLNLGSEIRIPAIYMEGSVEQRLELFRSILEVKVSGNYVSKRNEFRLYFTNNDALVSDICLLANSLGVCITKREEVKQRQFILRMSRSFIHKIDAHPKHFEEVIPYKSPRRNDYHSIMFFKKVEPCEQTCLLVDNPEHLYLTEGYVVTHNTTSARLFARALNCKHLDKDICGTCVCCKESLMNSPYYTELDNSMLGIDDIRDMRDTLFYPIDGLNRVIVFDEVQLLPPKAQATLLKVLEETTHGIHFLLATTNPENVLPTIRSRSLELEFRVKSFEEIMESLKKLNALNGWNFSDKALRVVASKSQGHMRNAHMMLERLVLLGEKEFLETVVPLQVIIAHIVEACILRNRDLLLSNLSQLMQSPMSEISTAYQEFFVKWMMSVVRPVEGEMLSGFTLNLKKRGISPEKVALKFMESWVVKSLNSEPEFKVAMMALFTTWRL